MTAVAFDAKLKLLPGDFIDGRYEAARRIARGGMAEVWAVRHLAIDQEFAMKLLAPLCGLNDDTVSRFELEARLGGLLGRRTHHVVPVVDEGLYFGRPYLVMPLYEGISLEDRIEQGPLVPEESARVVRHVARALTVAHAVGIVHRDLKPGNVLLTREDGRMIARVIDFGLARGAPGMQPFCRHHTSNGIVLGTPMNMSPEQARGEIVDERADVWGLACLAYRSLLAKDAFTGRSTREVLIHVCEAEFKLPTTIMPSLPRAIDGVFARAFARAIDRRFPTPRAFSDAYESALGIVR
ncbi:MAG: serine/threonine protein kinase [Deltaproteobacteria bacterium]|nr:serine/threonine protein kinase [Deltaproteobacteria bacterium]